MRFNKEILMPWVTTMFRMFSLSWIFLGLLEWFFPGFVSNYFSVHWLFFAALFFGIILRM